MPRLAQINDVPVSRKTIYINPLNVIAVEEHSVGTTLITMVDNKVYTTKQDLHSVVNAIQAAMS